MTRRRLKLKSPTASEAKLRADPSDLGRLVRVRPMNQYGRCWWVNIHEITPCGEFIEVGPAQQPLYSPEPVPAKRQNRGFGRRRWVRTADVVTWKRKALP